MTSTAACIFSVFLSFAGVNAAEISYTYSNQTAWDTLPGSSCAGSRQSPIGIDTAQLANGEDFGLAELVMSNWNVSTRGTWSNNGHTVQYTPDNAVTATTTTYLGVYNFAQLHFHWGPSDNYGSEHLVDSIQYSGELHFVHQKAETPDDPGNGYTVVGVLLRADPSLELTDTVWDRFAADIPDYSNDTALGGIVLNEMLPGNLSYYYYNGSLTTPLCSEIVQWVLLRYPVDVPADFFEALRLTNKDSSGNPLTENYRDVQPLGQRQVYSYTATPSSASTPTSVVALLLMVVMIAQIFI